MITTLVGCFLASATLAVAQTDRSCVGDCNADGQVTVDDLLTMINVALGNEVIEDCRPGDTNVDDQITVDEILTAINGALNGCASVATPTPLQGTDAVQAASRAALNTLQSIQILDFGYVSAQPAASRFRLAGTHWSHDSTDLRGRSTSSVFLNTVCDNPAAANVTCDPTSDTLSVVYTECRTTTGSGNLLHTFVRNGRVSQTVASCDAPNVAPDVTTLVFNHFRLIESDAADTEVANINVPALTDHFVPTDGSCSAADGSTLLNSTETIDGTETIACTPGASSIRCAAAGINLTVTAHALTLQRTVKGTPCQLTVTTQGGLDIKNLATAESFSQTFASTRLTETADADGSATVSIDGPMNVDCLGAINFQTDTPLLLQSGVKCPSDGTFDVSLPTRLTGGAATSAAAAATREVTAAETVRLTTSTLTDAGETTPPGGLHDFAFRAANGQVYQVIQNAGGNPDFGIDDFRITTVAGSMTDLASCDIQRISSGAVDGVAARDAFGPDRVVKSARIKDATAPCFNPRANGGDGVVCIGPGCAPGSCECSDGNACTTFTNSNGTPLDMPTDVARATLVDAPSTFSPSCTSLVTGRSALRFGPSGPTTDVTLCEEEPTDGVLLPNAMSQFTSGADGTTFILAYDVPFGAPFLAGSAGFPIQRADMNPNPFFSCHADQVVIPGVVNRNLKLPPRVLFRAAGVAFDYNADAVADDTVPTCEHPSLLLCVPAPIPTPTPNAACNPPTIGSQLHYHFSGMTAGSVNAFGGASCGGGGNQAPDFAVAYKAPTPGYYTIDTVGSDFDTILSLRDTNCSGTELACNDDMNLMTSASQVSAQLEGGQRIVIIVDGFGSASGAFKLNVNFESATAPTPTPTPTPLPNTDLPDLVVTTVTGPPSGTAGGQISVSATISNQGVAAAGAFSLDFLFSSDATIDANDIDTGFGCLFAGLAAGASAVCSGPIDVPASLTPGTYFLGAFVDVTNQVAESDEDNNRRAGGQIVIGAGSTPTVTATPTMTPSGSRSPTPTPTNVTTATFTAAATTTATPTPPATTTRTITPSGPSASLTLSPRVVTLAPNGGQATLTVSIPQPAATPVTVTLTIGDANIAGAVPTVIIPAGQTSVPVTVHGNNLGATTLSATGPGNAAASIYVTAPFTGTGTFVAAVSIDVPAQATPSPTPFSLSALALAPAVGVQVASAATATPTTGMISTDVIAAAVAVQIAAAATQTPTAAMISASVGALPVAVQVAAAATPTPAPISFTANILALPVGVQVSQ